MYKKELLEIFKENYKLFDLQSIPAKIEIQLLAKGESNFNYLVLVNNTKFIFRLPLYKDRGKGLENEYNLSKILPSGLAPKVFYFDNSKKIIPYIFSIIEFMEGEHTTKWNNKMLIEHARKLSKLHQLKSDKSMLGRKFSVYKRLIHEIEGENLYQDQIKNNKILSELFEKIKEKFLENEYLFSNMKEFSLIHGDLCLTNMLYSKNNGPIYIDWEWYYYGDVAFDFAKFYNDVELLPWYIKLDKDKEKVFLDAYQKEIKDETLKQRISLWQIYIQFTDLIYFMWKVENYDKNNSAFPKEKYEDVCNISIKNLKEKMLEIEFYKILSKLYQSIEIESITTCTGGAQNDVYDIKCKNPNKNFIFKIIYNS